MNKKFKLIFTRLLIVTILFTNISFNSYANNADISYSANTNNNSNFSSAKEIAKICGLKAKCESDINACVINIDTDHNPYDVVYDYGEEYNAYVEACDWSLVFDADYYMKTFPMLALQYNYDKDLLLEHFQTVGIHEGRQGSENFNVIAYYYNCSKEVYNAFKKNYEGYYFYYMLNYSKEKNVNTKSANNGKKTFQQVRIVLTKMQLDEFNGITKYRDEVNSPKVTYDSELQAFANFRAYINSKENWDAHDWIIKNEKERTKYLDTMNNGTGWKFAENNITSKISNVSTYKVKDWSNMYYKSPEHYEAMVKEVYLYTGVSNFYIATNNRLHSNLPSKYEGSQFDVYMNSVSNAFHK